MSNGGAEDGAGGAADGATPKSARELGDSWSPGCEPSLAAKDSAGPATDVVAGGASPRLVSLGDDSSGSGSTAGEMVNRGVE